MQRTIQTKYSTDSTKISNEVDKLYMKYLSNNQKEYLEIFNNKLNPEGIELAILK